MRKCLCVCGALICVYMINAVLQRIRLFRYSFFSSSSMCIFLDKSEKFVGDRKIESIEFQTIESFQEHEHEHNIKIRYAI